MYAAGYINWFILKMNVSLWAVLFKLWAYITRIVEYGYILPSAIGLVITFREVSAKANLLSTPLRTIKHALLFEKAQFYEAKWRTGRHVFLVL